MRRASSLALSVIAPVLLGGCGGGQSPAAAPPATPTPSQRVAAPAPAVDAVPASASSAADAGAAHASGSADAGLEAPASYQAEISFGRLSAAGKTLAKRLRATLDKNSERVLDCYKDALSRNPGLRGHVAVKLALDTSGLQSATDNGSDMPDHGVILCVVGAFRAIKWPTTRSGVTTVVVPVGFSSDYHDK